MNAFINRLRSRRRDERGNDLITSIFMIPIILGLIFVLIDVSVYFQARSEVQNVARDSARTIALLGGDSKSIPLNNLGAKPSELGLKSIWDGSKCLPSACSKKPTISCSPDKATQLNQQVTCRVNYFYQPAGGALVSWLGFGDLLTLPISSSEVFRSETFYR